MSVGNMLCSTRDCPYGRNHTPAEIQAETNRHKYCGACSKHQCFVETSPEIQIKLRHRANILSWLASHHSIIHHRSHACHVAIKRSRQDKLAGNNEHHEPHKDNGEIGK